MVRFIRTLFRFCRELYTLNEYNIPNKCWKLNLNFTKSCPYLSRFCNYTEKRQITGRKYSRHFTNKTSSEWVKLLNNFWTGTNMYLKTFTFICKVLCCHLTHLSCPYCTCMALSALRRTFAVFLRTLFCLMFRMYV